MRDAAFLIAFLVLSGIGAPAAAAPPDERSDLAARVEQRYLRLKVFMAELLSEAEEPDQAGRLDTALKRSRELQIVDRLGSVRKLLDADRIRDAHEEQKLIEKDLRRILRILSGEDELEQLRRDADEIAELEEQLQRLERVLEEEEKNLEETEELLRQLEEKKEQPGTSEEERRELEKKLREKQRELSRKLRDTRDQIQQIRRELERQRERRERRDGQQRQDQNQGQQNQGQQQGQQQQGQQQQGQRQQGQQQRREDIQSLNRASRDLQEAAQRMDASNPEGSREDQERALAELKRAREELERQREELEDEKQRNVAQMALGKLYGMLARQQLASQQTKDLDAREDATAEVLEQECRSLAREEGALHTDASDVLSILEEDGSSVIAPAIIERVQTDLATAQSRLEANETGPLTQIVQQDIEAAIQELIDALNSRLEENRRRRRAGGGPSQQGGQQPGGQQGGGPQQRPLFDPLKELKLLLSMQRRVRQRTESLDELGLLERSEPSEPSADDESSRNPTAGAGPEAGDAEAANPEAARLRGEAVHRTVEAQQNMAKLLRALVEKYPEIDRYLLGDDNEPQDVEPGEDGEDAGPDAPDSADDTPDEPDSTEPFDGDDL